MATKNNGVVLYCVCRTEYQDDEFMIECDKCKEWFHGRYVYIRYDIIYFPYGYSIIKLEENKRKVKDSLLSAVCKCVKITTSLLRPKYEVLYVVFTVSSRSCFRIWLQ